MENAILLLVKILPDLITGIQEEIYRKTVKNGIQLERVHKIFYYIIRLGAPPPKKKPPTGLSRCGVRTGLLYTTERILTI